MSSPSSVGDVLSAAGLDDLPDDAHVVFVSYAREDERWRRRFATMLAPLGARGVVVWSDVRIGVGVHWRGELARAIARADAALVLVSPDLLASEFVMGEELPALRERRIPLAFVHVRASLVEEIDALADVQWAHDRARPLQGVNDADGEIVRICQRVANQLPVRTRQPVRARAAGAVARQSRTSLRLVGGSQVGELHGVPSRATGEVERDELDGLRDALLSSGDGAVGITGRGVGLHGQGGIGKTVLAAALARDDEVRRHFPDGIYWVAVGERGDVLSLQLLLLERLGAARPELRSREAAAGALRSALAGRRCLLVVDDVWTVAAAVAFNVVDDLARVLYTTRDQLVLVAVGANVRLIDVLPEGAARALLAELSGRPLDALPAAADLVLAATGRVALAVALVGAAIGAGDAEWNDTAVALDNARTTFLDHPYADVFKAMQVSLAAIGDRLAAAYQTLAVYPRDERVPVLAVARLWSQLHVAQTEEETRRMLGRLATHELIVMSRDAIGFHDLQHDFLLLRAPDLRLAHDDLLDAYRALLPDQGRRWHRLPPGEPYIWEHLLEHLAGAGDNRGALEIVTDLAYLAVRCARDGPYAAESDLRAAGRLFPGDEAIAWATDTLTRWGHLFAGDTSAHDVALTLAIRAQHPPAPIDVDALIALSPAPLLKPRWGVPEAPDALLRTFAGHSDAVHDVVFSPDGRRLVSAGGDGMVRLWDPETGRAIGTLERSIRWVNAVAFSPDGTRLAGAGGDGTVRLWDPESGRATATLERPIRWVNAVAWSPDGTWLASAGDDGTVRLWNPARGDSTPTAEAHSGAVRAVAFSPKGTPFASAGGDGAVRLWDLGSGRAAATLEGHTAAVTGVTFSPDGAQLASVSGDGTVRLWNAASGRATATFEGHSGWVRAVAWSPDGTQVASAGDDGTVRLWDPASGRSTLILQGHTGAVLALTFSPDGARLASAGGDGTVRLWDPGGGRRTGMPGGHLRTVTAVAFSPDGTRLASAGFDGTVRLWDPVSGRRTAALGGGNAALLALAFSPDGRQVASADLGGTVRLWDAAAGRAAAAVMHHTGWVGALAFSAYGALLASAGLDETVRLWELPSGRAIAALHGHSGAVLALAFSPDGRCLASAGFDGTIRLWDPASDRAIAILEGHSGWVNALAFSPDGLRLASAGGDATVRLWHGARAPWGRPAWGIRRQRRRPNAKLDERGPVASVAFSPDGRMLASTGDDTIALWDIAGGTELVHARTGSRIADVSWRADRIVLAMGTAVACFDVVCSGPSVATSDTSRSSRFRRRLRILPSFRPKGL